VKSKQDFHEILAADDPSVWRTNRPVEGGATGTMLRAIIEKAAALKAERGAKPRKVPSKQPRRPSRGKKKPT
jgi:hypothetical protein